MRVSPSERCPVASDSTVAMVSKAMRGRRTAVTAFSKPAGLRHQEDWDILAG
ncbi:hypothetical protein Aca07nite_66640 [Actinoplanes capillaceus]|uniref:Uncharacterized protein n=1 Tax=Actinoplanes campanulatus TaxID=113559 RepID=A0ABQ3WT08_9ACTN|nr:hypothetical protein Aca07nite_66640 [Actinoplanes capillaceus]